MAIVSCLHHRPAEPHYYTYARLLAYLELPCTEGGCAERVIIWLNPEEVKDYERGTRLFYDADFNAIRVESSGLSDRVYAPLKLPRPNFRPLKAFRSFGPLRKREAKR